ncbi:hypothetical protein E2C01_097213 [Portunus trituberculatus]|uniref:Uncharacterized protein n=1 Tax=Portunus trituberculatus TaxID=210409 RepID=A0A5B7KAN2_PORTR|nr:hypothetical protein [Portunus trituberculatus]
MLGDSTNSSPPGYRAFFSTSFPEQGHHGGRAILARQDIPIVSFATQLFPSVPLQTIPRTSGRFTKRPVPWLSAACTKAVEEN